MEPERPAVGEIRPIHPETGAPNGLTCIPRRIHCPDTNAIEAADELDRIAIDNFLTTLAEVALSVARRKERLDE